MQNRITPTHFVEFWTHPKTSSTMVDNIPHSIIFLNRLSATEEIGGKTIAIGYIQYTDVPLSERLVKRGIKMINQ